MVANANNEPLNGIIVDNIKEICLHYKKYLERTGKVIFLAMYHSGEAVMKAPEELLQQANFIMLDQDLKDKNGIDIAKWLQSKFRNKPVLIYTSHSEGEFFLKLSSSNLRSHYGMVLRKNIVSAEQLLPILQQIIDGGIYRSPEIETKLSLYNEQERYSPVTLLKQHKDENLEKIFKLNGQGFSTRQIAKITNFSEKSILNKLAKIYEVLYIDISEDLGEENVRGLMQRRAAIIFHVDRLLSWSNDGEIYTLDDFDQPILFDKFKENISSIIRDASDISQLGSDD